MKEERIIFLDGIRGIAAIMVVFYHYFLAFYPALFTLKLAHTHTVDNLESSVALTPISILYNGSFAVCMFFVLSGYVLSLKFFRDKNIESIYSGAFKRYFRLAIPILFSVFLSYLLFISNSFHHVEIAKKYSYCTIWLSNLWNMSSSFWNMLYEGTYRVLFIGGNSEYNPALWTMYLEFTGSLIVFAIIGVFGNLKNRFLIYLALIFAFRNSYYLAFILGLFLCDYYNSKFKIKIHWAINLIIAIIALYIASYQEFETKNMWSVLDGVFPHTRQTLSFIGAFLILFVVLNSSFLKKNLSKNIFHYLGNISFSVYLLHLLVLGSISCYLFKFFIETFHWEYFTSFIVMFFISVAIIFTLSHFMYKFIDEKGMKFSAYLYNKFFKHEPRIK